MTWEMSWGWLQFLIPILLGAVIGFVTNDIAVRMLFRPLKAYHLGRLRIPFTPGIIPAQRKSLARNIGQMVSQQLLTAETIRQHLEDPITLGHLRREIETSLRHLAEKPFADHLSNLRHDWARGMVHHGIQFFLQRVLASRFTDFFPDQSAPLANLSRHLAGFLAQPEVRERALQLMANLLREMTEQDRPLLEVTGPETIPILGGLLTSVYDPVTAALIQWLRTPAARVSLIENGRAFLVTVIDRMNGLQKFFLSAVQYDRNLTDSMPEIVDDLTSRLEGLLAQDSQKAALVGAIQESLQDYLSQNFASVADGRDDQIRQWLLDLITKAWDRLTASLAQPTESLLVRGLGPIVDQPIGPWLERHLGLTSAHLAAFLEDQAMGFLASAQRSEANLGNLFGWQAADYQLAADWLTKAALRALEPRIESLLAGIDLQRLVEDKINRLDTADVEKLLMAVLKKHLKWINIFGAILGALMGALQYLLPH